MFYADSNNIMRLRIRIFSTGVFFIYIEKPYLSENMV